MLFPARLTEVFWFIYNFTNFLIAAGTALEAFMSLAPNRAARKEASKAAEKDWTFPTRPEKLPIIDIVIVAYLPNEKDIIVNRIHYAVEEIVYPKDKIRINVVYNTPKPIEPLETQLWELAGKYQQLRIIKVENSTSKADNLNYFLSLETGSDITAVFVTTTHTRIILDGRRRDLSRVASSRGRPVSIWFRADVPFSTQLHPSLLE
jgi:hypothetical protein